MAYVITNGCVGVCESECVTPCPVDCIAGPFPPEQVRAVPRAERVTVFGPGVRMYIDPDVCIDCGACEPHCPVQAIVHEDDLPPDVRAKALAEATGFFASRR
jgi:NAD-dependent dihydropyrimidine dehydrogenase PreA subunit